MSASPLLCPPEEKARLEARNGVRQLDYISSLVNAGERQITDIRESHVLGLHAMAVQDIYPCGGNYRDALSRVVIKGSTHQIPHEALVPSLVRDLVDRLNAGRASEPAIYRAAYALWRLNWIHPFRGGNGRTARALSYLVICMDMQLVPPGIPQMPVLIYQRRDEYVRALQGADVSVSGGAATPDLQAMNALVEDAMTQQLAGAIARLAGRRPS